MPNLSDLQLTETAAPAVDWDAPESGQQAPPVYPGLFTLLFKMPDDVADWYDVQESETVKGNPTSKQKFLVILPRPFIIAAHATRDAQGQPLPLDPATNQPPQLPPQRFSFYKNDKMLISQGGELLRALGIRIEGSMLRVMPSGKKAIEEAVEAVNGRVNFMAEVGWRAYFKSTGTTVSTHPRGKKSGELPWPRQADGTPEMLATNPQTGEKAFGYPDVFKIVPPASATS